MITTIDTANAQKSNGSYRSGSGQEVILIQGSCRGVPFLNALTHLNRHNRFTIHFIDPCYYNWDSSGKPQNLEVAIGKLETDGRLLSLLKSVKWYIHEYYENYWMFNTNKSLPKHIYQFGINPELDITIPNFNNHFILFQDIVTYDKEMREKVRKDLQETGGSVREETQRELTKMGLADVEKFCQVCLKSDFPEMEKIFRETWTKTRYFWTINHITNAFTKTIMQLMNDKFLHLDTNGESWDQIIGEDLYHTPHTPLTQMDAMHSNYGIQWPESVAAIQV